MTKNKQRLHPVWDSLLAGLAPPRLITLVGGGGKTSLMYYLVAGLKTQGVPAVATTTTKLLPPRGDGHRLELADTLAAARRAVTAARESSPIITLAGGTGGEKLTGLDPAWLDILAAENDDLVFIVEGDGSAGLPLKGHLAHEPVVPAATRLVVPVVGVEAIGRPLAAGNVHRPDRAAVLAGAAPGQPVSVRTVARLLLHPDGYLHNCPPDAKVVPFVNKAEDTQNLAVAQRLAAEVLAAGHPATAGVIYGSVRADTFRFVRK